MEPVYKWRGKSCEGKIADTEEKGKEGKEVPAGDRGEDPSAWWGPRGTAGNRSALQRQDGNPRRWHILKDDRDGNDSSLMGFLFFAK